MLKLDDELTHFLEHALAGCAVGSRIGLLDPQLRAHTIRRLTPGVIANLPRVIEAASTTPGALIIANDIPGAILVTRDYAPDNDTMTCRVIHSPSETIDHRSLDQYLQDKQYAEWDVEEFAAEPTLTAVDVRLCMANIPTRGPADYLTTDEWDAIDAHFDGKPAPFGGLTVISASDNPPPFMLVAALIAAAFPNTKVFPQYGYIRPGQMALHMTLNEGGEGAVDYRIAYSIDRVPDVTRMLSDTADGFKSYTHIHFRVKRPRQ